MRSHKCKSKTVLIAWYSAADCVFCCAERLIVGMLANSGFPFSPLPILQVMSSGIPAAGMLLGEELLCNVCLSSGPPGTLFLHSSIQ